MTAVAKNPSYCCNPTAQPCGSCTQCVRGAWITLPALIVEDTSSITCECGCYGGKTFYVPFGKHRLCEPETNVPYSCNDTVALANAICPFPMPDDSFPIWSCQGCWEEYRDTYPPPCEENYICGECVVTETGQYWIYLSGNIGWGIRGRKIGGVWVLQSYVSLLTQTGGFFWVRTVTTGDAGATSDCSQLSGAHAFHCNNGGLSCVATGTTASVTFDLGPCP